MACGVPLVATTGGALPEVVGTDGETALLVPPNDPDALASTIARDARRPRAAGPHRRGRPRAGSLDRFTWRQTAEGTVENWYRALDSTHGAARADRAEC